LVERLAGQRQEELQQYDGGGGPQHQVKDAELRHAKLVGEWRAAGRLGIGSRIGFRHGVDCGRFPAIRQVWKIASRLPVSRETRSFNR
jgi:hypothetical protein